MNVFSKAIPGFNHNVKHKGKCYHIQTEDSGIEKSYIATHLFVGGTVVASKKTSYADIINAENISDVVRDLMEEQHKAMLRSLLAGNFETKEDSRPVYEPGQVKINSPEIQLNKGIPLKSPPSSTLPATKPRSPLFGEDVISEKSLDEVILAYLAGESDGKP